MSRYINWLMILLGLLLVTLFGYNLHSLPSTASQEIAEGQFWVNPYDDNTNAQSLNSPHYRQAYENHEADWTGAYGIPKKKSVIDRASALTSLYIFGGIGFIANLFFRSIFLYGQWRDGEEINWPWQAFLLIAIPAAYILAMMGLMHICGY